MTTNHGMPVAGFVTSLLVLTTIMAGGQDRGKLSLEPRRETRTLDFIDGRSVIAYNQSGTMTEGNKEGPWEKATLFVQGTEFKDAGGTVISEVALWEMADPEGDLVWGTLWQPAGESRTLRIRSGTGKWKGITGQGVLLNIDKEWEIDWSVVHPVSIIRQSDPGDYIYHDSGFSFHGPHIIEMSRTLPDGAILLYGTQSGVLLSNDLEAKSPRNLATCYDRGTTYRIGDRNLADIMLLEDTDPDGDIVWLYHEWWYGSGPGSYEFIGGTGKWKGISGYGRTLGVLRERVDDHWLIKSEMHWNLSRLCQHPMH